ncbi:23S rRNA (adenine(2503)-C(2))-methyltransferase RlmN [Planctomycetota bacterium]
MAGKKKKEMKRSGPEKTFYDYSSSERLDIIEECEGASFVSGQINNWVFRKNVCSFSEMTNLSKWMRQELEEQSPVTTGHIEKMLTSRDNTQKGLVRFPDGTAVECVSIPSEKRITFCVSTMAGCPGKCLFCASGQHGLARNLSRGEMLSQYLLFSLAIKNYPTNVVLMGSGEPLLNFKETRGFLFILNDPKLADLGARRITVSTIGIPDGIIGLAKEELQFEIAFSLHHPVEKERKKLIPLSRKYPLAAVIEALLVYNRKTNRLPTFEYCLLAGINDSVNCARETARLAKRVHAKVNLIPYNRFSASFSPPDKDTVNAFKNILYQEGVTVTVREQRGADIDAACGQLAGYSKL